MNRYNVEEFAKKVGITKYSLRKLHKDGIFQGIKIGNFPMFYTDDHVKSFNDKFIQNVNNNVSENQVDSYRAELQKYCDEREFELFFIDKDPHISAFGMVKYTNHKNSQDMLVDFLDKEKRWFDNPIVITHEVKNAEEEIVTHYLIPFNQAIRFLEMYQMCYVWEGDVNLKELLEEPKHKKREKKFKITSITLQDWLNKYNIGHGIIDDRLYVYTVDLMEYTKSKYPHTVWTKLGDAKIINGPKIGDRSNHMMVRIGDAIKCLKKSDVIDEFPEITTLIKFEVNNRTDTPTPAFEIQSVKQTGDSLNISINIIKD